MDSIFWYFTFSFSIYVAGIIAALRFRKINKAYYPFIICIWIGCINELIALLLYLQHSQSSLNINLYVYLESICIILLFKNLGVLKKPKYLFHGIIISFTLVWITEILLLNSFHQAIIFFRIFFSFVIVLISISYINILIGRSQKLLLKNSDFLLCLVFILFFTYMAVVQSFWLYGLNSGEGFLIKVFTIMVYINLISNLIIAFAVLWMPRKIEYSQPY